MNESEVILIYPKSMRRSRCASVLFSLLVALGATAAQAGVIATEFNTSDGFVTGGTDPVRLADGAFEVEFSGGQQQQMFDGPSYNNGPAAYLFINGGGGFTGTSGNTAAPTGDGGLIQFFGGGASYVSFHAANRGNGAFTRLSVFGLDSSLLTIFDVVETVQSMDSLVVFDASSLGGTISYIEIDLPGPAGRPPYVLSVDTFRAVGVPEPSTLALLGLGLLGLTAARKRST